jgi:hypothetical protein
MQRRMKYLSKILSLNSTGQEIYPAYNAAVFRDCPAGRVLGRVRINRFFEYLLYGFLLRAIIIRDLLFFNHVDFPFQRPTAILQRVQLR